MCEPATDDLERRSRVDVNGNNQITVSPRWVADWVIRIAIILGTSFAGLAWAQVRDVRDISAENKQTIADISERTKVIENEVEAASAYYALDESRMDALEGRAAATEQNRFTSQQGLEVWRELDTKISREELAAVVLRLSDRFNRLDDKLDRLITLAGDN